MAAIIEPPDGYQDWLKILLGNIFDPRNQTQPPAFSGMEAQRPKSLPELMAEMIIRQQVNKPVEIK